MMTITERLVLGIAQQARLLPLPEAVNFLYSFLRDDEGNSALDLIRRLYVDLSHCDRQLLLIAEGQLRLDFGSQSAEALPSLPTVGDRFRWARQRQSLTLAGLAQRTGVSDSTLCNVENNRDRPGRKLTRSVATQLCVPAEWLLIGRTLSPNAA